MIVSTLDLRDQAQVWERATPSEAAPWQFKDDGAEANPGPPATQVSYAFLWAGGALPDFAAAWKYDPALNAYRRSMAGRAHVDAATGETLAFKNVIVQFDSARVADRDAHIVYGSVGEGPAHIFLDGRLISGTWTKPSLEERTRYWDVDGTEVQLNRGASWVAVLPYNSPFSWR